MKIVLVTGATSGFGKSIVQKFLQEDNFLVLATGRNINERKQIFQEERKIFPDRLIELPLDVTKKEDFYKIKETIEKKFSKLDILINNAGYGVFGPLEEISEEVIREQMEVNFFGPTLSTKILLPLIRKVKGKIINMSSVFGFMGFPMTSIYCASKFAVEGLVESLWGELRPHGVQVCLVEPTGYRTNFNKNIQWVGLDKDNSPYSTQMKNYKIFNRNLTNGKGQSPKEVSEKIFELASSKSIPLRVAIGKGSSLAVKSRKLLPPNIYFYLIGKRLKKLFLKE